jgi:hypothetical protein
MCAQLRRALVRRRVSTSASNFTCQCMRANCLTLLQGSKAAACCHRTSSPQVRKATMPESRIVL